MASTKFKRFSADVDVVAYIATHGHISEIPTVLVEAARKSDFVIYLSNGNWAVRPKGRKLLMKRVESDMKAIAKIVRG